MQPFLTLASFPDLSFVRVIFGLVGLNKPCLLAFSTQITANFSRLVFSQIPVSVSWLNFAFSRIPHYRVKSLVLSRGGGGGGGPVNISLRRDADRLPIEVSRDHWKPGSKFSKEVLYSDWKPYCQISKRINK